MGGLTERSKLKKNKTIWILVLSKRGFIEEPELFSNERVALKRKKKLMNDFNPDYDEIEIFEKEAL